MRRAVKIAVISIAILIVVPLLVLVLVVGTESGTRWAFDRASGYLPDGIRAGRVEGRLADRLVLHDIEVETDDLRLALARAELRWTPSTLWRGRLAILDVQATQLRVVMLPGEAEPETQEPLELPERVELPVDVVLGHVAVSDIQIFSAPEAEPLEIDTIELAATFVDSQLDLEQLRVLSPLLDLEAVLAITAAGDYPMRGRFDWTLRLPDYPEVRGATRLDGTLAELHVDQELAAPYNTRSAATLTNATEALHVTADAQVRDLDPSLLHPDLPPALLNLDLRAQGPVDALELEANLGAVGLDPGPIEAALTARFEPDSVLIHRLLVTQPAHEARVEAAGRVLFEEAISADLRMAWQRLQWPIDDEPAVSSPRGELHFTGPLDDYRLSVATVLRVPEQPPATLEATGAGSLEAVALELRARTPSGRLHGRADVVWEPAIETRIDLAGEDIDPELFAAGWPGRVGFELAAEGGVDGDVVSVRIDRFVAAGVMRDEAVELEVRGAYRHDSQAVAAHSVDIDALSLAMGGLRLDADGRVAESADLSWRMSAPDLSVALATARGRLAGSGTITGSLPRPRIQVQLEGAELAYGEHALEQLDLRADLDLTGAVDSSLDFHAQRGRVADVVLERLQLSGAGTPHDHRLRLALRSSDGDADLDLEGRLAEPLDAESTWRFRLTEARLAYPELAAWDLDEPAEGIMAIDEASVARHCWISGDARLCLAGARTEASLEADFELSALPFAYLAPFLPHGYELSGEVGAAGTLRQLNGEPLTAELVLEASAGEIVMPADASEGAPAIATRLRLEPSHVRLVLLPHEATADVSLATEHGHVRLDARLPAPDSTDIETSLTERPLSGLLSIDLPSLSFVADVVPDLTDVEGAVVGRLDLAGTLANPALTGGIRLEQGAAHVPAAGITVTGLTLDVEGRGGDSVELTAAAASGGGTLALTGELTLLGEVPSASLRVQGQAFQLANTPEARLYATPDLEITAGAERIDVVGEVLIPRAEITPGTPPPAAMAPSADQILLSAEEDDAELATQRDLHARVRIILGEEVSFEGYGLSARFTGNLLAVQAPGAPITGTGELNILDGEYRAYGQGLVIETGNVYFAGGPLTEPALDIRAVRRPQEGILVGAHVVGTLEEPQFTLFSEPPMTQQEQLSYLVLGRSLQEAPSGESSALSQAALSMGLRGGDYLARNIGERLGVDQLAIETGSGEAGAASDPSQAALVAGKYLSPRLYVSYGIGLFDPINVLRIQYTIADSWRLVTQSSSEATGADLIYTIERGR